MSRIAKVIIATLVALLAQLFIIFLAHNYWISSNQFLVFQSFVIAYSVAVLFIVRRIMEEHDDFNKKLHRIKTQANLKVLNHTYGELGGRWIQKVDGNNRLIHIYEQRRTKD